MNSITLQQPGRIIFGRQSLQELSSDVLIKASDRILVLAAVPVLESLEKPVAAMKAAGKTVRLLEYGFQGEPTIDLFEALLNVSEIFRPDCVVGIGGGSVLDCAKLLAALSGGTQPIRDIIGIGLLNGRSIGLICIPTTSGTGSDVSPNAILLDEQTASKSGIISPFLVPDACYIDPVLTLTLPPRLTAETGMDALCHCVEAFTNKNAHPMIDVYALKGINLITANLLKACENGMDSEARSALSLGSLYGGLCLGPVNTTAVHALSYGLGGKHHVPHGLANAMLLPEVLWFNLPFIIDKLAQMALVMGLKPGHEAEETAIAGIEAIRELSFRCGIPQHLSDLGITEKDIPELVDIALNVKRLLNNNSREVTREDAMGIFKTLL